MLLTSSMLGPSLPLHKAEFRKSLIWGLVCLLAQRVLLWLENDGSSFKTSCLFVVVRSQYAISLCYECLSKTDHESSIDLRLRLNKASWIEFLVLRLKCLGLVICYSFYKAIFTKAVRGPEFDFTSNIYICFPFLSSSLHLSPEDRISLFWTPPTDRLSLPLRTMATLWTAPSLLAGNHSLWMSMIKQTR